MATIGIRREDKNIWERRTPITPEDVKRLREEDIDVIVETSDIRAFSDDEYREAGAEIREDLDDVPIIFGVKEIPSDYFDKGKTFVYFSHTIKGQEQNMPMLKDILENDCTLIDYERFVDENDERLVFFGYYAGYAGMMDSLWALGKRLNHEGIKNPFSDLEKMIDYDSLEDAQHALKEVSKKIERDGLPEPLKPMVVGFAGYGHVSQTAQEMLDLLPTEEVRPEELYNVQEEDAIYKVVFKEEDMVQPNDPNKGFQLQEYYDHPERYHSIFSRYLPELTVLMNCVYWDKPYPRLVTKESLRQLYHNEQIGLKVIGDISCDVEGGIECNLKTTDPGEPVYTYDPLNQTTETGVDGEGPVILAVDNLPCEMPRESSKGFSESLFRFVPALAGADYERSFDKLELPLEVKKGVIAHRGELTPDYKYLKDFLNKEDG